MPFLPSICTPEMLACNYSKWPLILGLWTCRLFWPKKPPELDFSGTPTISNGVATVPMTFSCPAYVAGDAHRSSISMAMAVGAMAMASMSGSASGASVAAACTLPGVNGQPSCTEGCQPFAHVELVGAHPNLTIDDSSYTFICPDGGCNIDSSCSTTAPENKCEAGWVMGRPFSTQNGHVVSKLIQRKASGWAEDLGAETGRATSDDHFGSLITQIGLLVVHFRPSFEEIYFWSIQLQYVNFEAVGWSALSWTSFTPSRSKNHGNPRKFMQNYQLPLLPRFFTHQGSLLLQVMFT